MIYVFVNDVFSGKFVVDSEVIVCGWICICCDFKVGILFFVIYDGFCFNLIQVVVFNNFNNYDNEVLKFIIGCFVEVTGKIVEFLVLG